MARFIGIIRHGDENPDGSLTTNGRLQINGLSRQLKDFIRDITAKGEALIISPPGKATEETGEILGYWLSIRKAQFLIDPVLRSDPDKSPELKQVATIIESNQEFFKVILLITPEKEAMELPSFLGKHLLKIDVQQTPIDKGTLILIDVEQHNVHLLNGDDIVEL